MGTGTIATYRRHYRPFLKARAFVHTLNFRNIKEWREYCKSGKKPPDIPTMPERYGSDYKGMGDWLGTGNVASKKQVFRPFAEARAYVRNLKVKNQDAWLVYCKSGQKPADIPSNPDVVYLAEFESYGDWLGNGNVHRGEISYRPFLEARAFVRALGLNYTQWMKYRTSGEKPSDIPSNPNHVYRSEYKGVGDWLGSGRTRRSLPFAAARDFAHTLHLKSYKEWQEYCRSGKKPPDIPSQPWRSYIKKYKNIADWLGIEYLPFLEARDFARALNLKNSDQWLAYCRSGTKPINIPSRPWAVYGETYGGIKDWLGVTERWNSNTLFTFLHELQPQLGHLAKRDLVPMLQENGVLNPFCKILGGATHKQVLNDLMNNGGKGLEQALKETQDHRGKVEIEAPFDLKLADSEPLQGRDRIFISYSHNDKRWLEKLQKMLTPLIRGGNIKVWADTQIGIGTKWREEVSKALANTKIAILLVTPNFLNSDFIAKHELPPLLAAAEKEGLVIFWIAVSASWYEETEIAQYQAANNPHRPLDSLIAAKRNEEWVRICKELKKAITQ